MVTDALVPKAAVEALWSPIKSVERRLATGPFWHAESRDWRLLVGTVGVLFTPITAVRDAMIAQRSFVV